jgi:excisionase family DNA binding protein
MRMTKKNRKRIQSGDQHPGVVKQGETPPLPAEKVQLVQKVSASTVEPLLLTIGDVCALLNVSRSTVLRLEKSSGLPGRVKIGGQVRYHREIIEKWLLEQTKS